MWGALGGLFKGAGRALGINALTGLLGGGDNKQQGGSTGSLVQDPNAPVKVRNVNSPLTPDSVVGLNELPSQSAILPNVKLEDIKFPKIENKTLQAHLKAIEAKMNATEKLMEDVLKLQNLQIVTEKELHERRTELYQNTFEEYLLDRTIDFDQDDDEGDCVCVNVPNKPKLPNLPDIGRGFGKNKRGGGKKGGNNSAAQNAANTAAAAAAASQVAGATTESQADKQNQEQQQRERERTGVDLPERVSPITPITTEPAETPVRRPGEVPVEPEPSRTNPQRQDPGRTQPATEPTTDPSRRSNPLRNRPPVRRTNPPNVAPPPGWDGPNRAQTPMAQNNIRPAPGLNKRTTTSAARPRTPVTAGGASYRSGLPGGKTGLLAMLLPFLTQPLSEAYFNSRVEELLKLKESGNASDLFNYDEQVDKIRQDAIAQKPAFFQTLTSLIGGGDIPAAYFLKALGELRPIEVPESSLVDLLMPEDMRPPKLTPDKNNDFTRIQQSVTKDSPGAIPPDLIPSDPAKLAEFNQYLTNNGVQKTIEKYSKDSPVPKASGGISNLELFNTDSRRYFDSMSSSASNSITKGSFKNITTKLAPQNNYQNLTKRYKGKSSYSQGGIVAQYRNSFAKNRPQKSSGGSGMTRMAPKTVILKLKQASKSGVKSNPLRLSSNRSTTTTPRSAMYNGSPTIVMMPVQNVDMSTYSNMQITGGSTKLEKAQTEMKSGATKTPTIVPLPPDYISLPPDAAGGSGGSGGEAAGMKVSPAKAFPEGVQSPNTIFTRKIFYGEK